MQTLIDSYTTLEEIAPSSIFSTFFFTEYFSGVSSIVLNDRFNYEGLNEQQIGLLEEFELLKDNWDGEFAKAPSEKALLQAKFIVKALQATGQKVFHVAPGPNGEIMVDIRKNTKSIEILFYKEKTKYVTFSENESPTQGAFEVNLLPQLLRWLNA